MNISVDKVTKAYQGTTVLKDISFQISKGEAVRVTGRSGSGKSTLIRLMLGFERPDFGEIRFDAEQPGVLFQEDRLLEERSGLENIRITVPFAKEEDILRIAEAVDLSENDMRHAVAELSGGERRRIALLRAFLFAKDLLILDEPFAGLDQSTKLHVKQFILENRRGRALIVTDHDGLEFPEEGFREISVEG